MNVIKIATVLTATAAIAACTPERSEMSLSQGELGSVLNSTGNLGLATSNNISVQRASAQDVIRDLTLQFAREAPAKVNFPFNKATLDAEAQDALRRQAAWIKRYPQVTFRVYGHADKVGSNSYNKALGLRRAQTVVNFLVTQGVPRKKLEAVASFGETKPLVLTDAPNRQNRRAVTEVKGFIEGDAGELDGKYARTVYGNYRASAAKAAN